MGALVGMVAWVVLMFLALPLLIVSVVWWFVCLLFPPEHP